MVMFALPAFGQMTRVAVASSRCAHANYVDVYEYDYVDVQPQFPGGDRAMVNFINKTRMYPYDAYEKGIQGRVICSFIVNNDGSVCNVSVIKGAHPSLNKEAVRIITKMPDWIAGKFKGEEVPVRCFLPIAFRL